MSAPFAPEPLTTATAELPRFASDFVRLTNWLVPKASFAGRFSRDMVAARWWLGYGGGVFTLVASELVVWW